MYKIITPNTEVLTKSIVCKLISKINELDSCDADYFYINSKNKILLLKHNLLGDLYLYGKNNKWEDATSIAKENLVLFTIPEDVLQQTKFKIKLEDTPNQDEDLEEVTVIGATYNTSTEDYLSLPDSFLSTNKFVQLNSIHSYLYSQFDPNYLFYGSIENEYTYTLGYDFIENQWLVEELVQGTVSHIASFSFNIINQLSDFLNSKEITYYDFTLSNPVTVIINKLNKKD